VGESLGEDIQRHPIELHLVGATSPQGVTAVRTPVGRYLLSLELIDSERERGWRARHGVVAAPLPSGVPALSDLLLLAPTHPSEPGEIGLSTGPDSLVVHLDRALPALRVETDSVEVAWEVYGVAAASGPVRFTLSVVSEERGTLRRALEFLRLAPSDRSIDLSWEEDLESEFESAAEAPRFRRLTLDLSSLPEGWSGIRLRMDLPGREEVASQLSFERVRPGR
jgi:hypothetical protein